MRVIADDECVKNFRSDIYILAANGIPCKTYNSAQFHMHNKFAIIDESVIVAGSFSRISLITIIIYYSERTASNSNINIRTRIFRCETIFYVIITRSKIIDFETNI